MKLTFMQVLDKTTGEPAIIKWIQSFLVWIQLLVYQITHWHVLEIFSCCQYNFLLQKKQATIPNSDS